MAVMAEQSPRVPLIPSSIELSIGRGCNCQCIMCPYTYTSALVPSHYVQATTIERAFVTTLPLLFNTTVRLNHAGGEATTHPQFERLIKFFEPYVKAIDIITNGQCLEDLDIHSSKLIATLSIDAAHRETYERIRIGASWDRLWKGVARASQSGTSLSCNFVLMNENKEEVEPLLDLLKPYGFCKFNLQYQIPSSEGKKLNPTKVDTIHVVERARQKCSDLGIVFEDRVTGFLELQKKQACFFPMERYADGSFYCSNLFHVSICGLRGFKICKKAKTETDDAHEWHLGSLEETELLSAYNSQKAWRVRWQMLNGNPNPHCQQCLLDTASVGYLKDVKGEHPIKFRMRRKL